jgi:hypothetical protein
MGALALPKAYSVATGNRALCARLGVRFNGADMRDTVHAYDMVEGWVRLGDGTVYHGKVEPFWRAPA